MTKLIRYLENNEWKYPTVKDVGDIEKLQTTNKTDLVSAINEITVNGGGSSTVIKDIQDRVETLETDSSTQKDQVEKNKQAIETQQQQVDNLQETQSTLEMEDRKIREEVSNKLDTTVYTNEYNQVKADLLDKVDGFKYKEDYNAITKELNDKVNSIDFNGLKGRVDTVQTDVINIEGEMSTKITRTEFDDAVGLNKWAASKYLTPDTDLNQTPPSFPLIKGRTPDEVTELEDSLNLIPFDGSGFITHLFTNVRLKAAKTLSLNLKYNDSLAVYMNGAKIYENKYNEQDPVNVSLSLRSGWNTIEILHGNQSGEPILSLETSISSQVDKLTAVIGVGDKNETRLAQAETNIKQTEDAILLKAEKQEVTNLGNRVSNNESSLEILNDQIKTKVEQQDFNAYSERLTNTESTVTQLSGEITSKVGKEEYNLLNEKVGTQETQIKQLSDSVSLKVDTEVFNGLEGRVKTNESEITATKDAIKLKASQEDLDTTKDKLTTAEGQISVLTGEISQTVKRTEFDNLNDRVVTSETAIKSNSDSILLKANKDDVYTKGEADTNVSTAVESAKAEIKLTTDGISQNVNKLSGDVESVQSYASGIDQKADSISQNVSILKSTVDEQGKTIQSQQTSITSLNDSISLKAEKSEVYTKEEADGAISSQISTAKSEIKQTTDSITSTVSDISNSVSSGLANLIRNSSFKSGFSYWDVTSGYWIIDQSMSVESCYAAKAEVSGLTKNGYKAIYSEFVDVAAGQEVNASVYSLVDDLNIDEGYNYSIEVEFYNDVEGASRLAVEGINIKPSSVYTWQRFNKTVKVPNGVTKARIRIHPSRNGRIWISRPMLVLGNSLPSIYSPMPSDTSMNSLTTQIKQTADEVSVNVVKKGNVLSSINASQEGVKISGDKVDIEGIVTFSSLDSATQNKINGIESTANEAKSSINDLSIGAMNLVMGTEFKDSEHWISWNANARVKTISQDLGDGSIVQCAWLNSKGVPLTTGNTLGLLPSSDNAFEMIGGQYYTLSGIITSSEMGDVLDYNYIVHSDEKGHTKLGNINLSTYPVFGQIGDKPYQKYYYVKFTFKADRTDKKARIMLGGKVSRDVDGSTAYAWIRASRLKIEEGKIATAWTPSVKDRDASITMAQVTADAAKASADKALNKGTLNGVPVGGAYSGGFILNENYAGNANAGEIHVLFGKFVHPDGSVWVHPAGSSDGEISTSLEGSNTDTLAYIMFTGSDPSRFGEPKYGRKDSMFNITKFTGSKWQYNNNDGWVDFTPNTSDCIVAQITRTSGSSNGIDDITFFTTVTMIDGNSIRTGLVNTDVVTISGGGTTIDKNGVAVRNGYFALEDEVSRQKCSLNKTRNFLKDHSFELLMGATNTYDYKKSYMDFSSVGSEYRWFTTGTPKLITAYNQPLEFSYAIHGANAMLVNSSNYVWQTVYQVGVGKTYTLSAYFKRHSSHKGGTPKFQVRVNYQIDNKIPWSQTKTFSAVPSNEDIVRYQFTFTVPTNVTINGADSVLQIGVMGNDSNWVIVDGVQLVQGDMATIYETDDALYNLTSPYGFPEEAQQIKTKEIRGTNASRALYVYDVREIQFSNNNSIWFDQYGNIKASDIVKTAQWKIIDDNGVALASFPVGSNKGNIIFSTKLEADVVGSLKTGTTNLYVGADGEVRVTDSKLYNGGKINYRPIRAGSFPTGSSVKYKSNIKEFKESAIDIVKDTKVFSYHLKNDLQNSIYDKQKVGFLNEAAPSLIRDEDGVDAYIVSSINWKATQELALETESLRKEVADLETVVEVLSAEITAENNKVSDLEKRVRDLEILVEKLASDKE
ncbi:hypothetical protein P8891_05955 [Bacillus atrophaeus]|uniref:hypothetical protein n=2 Tax=Bacillus atrophaeus TaxID=1452 RepID=UPI0022820732|nr:hypothetical protein [Bacillus atrophaeus]MCY7947016.1 hypothetical protein [Bacillus atrophaeus]MCY9170072.1 hypothetical protein [Bacillus atrophaeus]MEC0740626.1 hypothetical protein [Bacillus atrophaeus]MEC0746938.1 hypothetical protein [Bacillus atrophaeus]MEC0760576.1 hypothetical protein [Bacillus atrophaeus]